MDFKDWYNKELANDKRSAVYVAGAKRGFKAGQQSKQAEIRKAVLSLRNEFNLWADDTEQFHAVEAQIEQLEDLLK